MSPINRVPAGVPAGGQFAEGQRTEAESTSLTDRRSELPSNINGFAYDPHASFSIGGPDPATVAHVEAQVLAERSADLARRELGTVLTQRYPDAHTATFDRTAEGWKLSKIRDAEDFLIADRNDIGDDRFADCADDTFDCAGNLADSIHCRTRGDDTCELMLDSARSQPVTQRYLPIEALPRTAEETQPEGLTHSPPVSILPLWEFDRLGAYKVLHANGAVSYAVPSSPEANAEFDQLTEAARGRGEAPVLPGDPSGHSASHPSSETIA